jgi:hypothetical protein
MIISEIINNVINEYLVENKYVDGALDRLSQVNGDVERLNELDKLILYAPSGDVNKLKRINIIDIFRELGGTLGYLMVEVKVKDYNEQRIQNHKFSKQYAGEIGYLLPYINYDNNQTPFVTVQFDNFISNLEYNGGGSYEQAHIYLANLYPIGYNDTNDEFIKYQTRVDLARKERSDYYDDENERLYEGNTNQSFIDVLRNINVTDFDKNIKGGFLNKIESDNLQKELESYYNSDSRNLFGTSNKDIRAKLFNYDTPIAKRELNGVDIRIAVGPINDKQKTYLLYGDGSIIGLFYSIDDIKWIFKYIEANFL